MDKHVNTAGYDLYEITQDEWIVNLRGGRLFAGTFKDVVTHAVTKMGFELKEIEYAVKIMIEKGHNASHFGMYRGFIFTFQKEFKDDRRAS